jgi:hypothetical protein
MSRSDFIVSIGHAGHIACSVGLSLAEERVLLRCLRFCLGCSNWFGVAEDVTAILEMLFRMFERGAVPETASPFSWKPIVELA